MKTKTFTKLISVLLVLSTLLTFGTIVASADGGTSTGASTPSASTAFKLENGDLSSIGNVDNASYSSNTIKYYGAYLGTNGTVEGRTAGEFVEINNNGTTFSASTWFQGCKFGSAYHYLMAVGFTAPKTATYRFEYQYGMAPWAIGNTNEHYDILIGTDFAMAGDKNATKNSALYNEMIPREAGNDFAANPPVSTKTCEVKLNAGETLYFAFMNTNNGGYGLFWLKTIEELTFNYTGVTSWDFGDVSELNGFINSPLVSYVCYNQGPHDGIATAAGMYDMKLSYGLYGGAYIVGEVTKDDNTTEVVRNSYFKTKGTVAPQYWFSPGLAFTAPYTGTMEFTLQLNFGNVEHRVVVARESKPLSGGGNYTNHIAMYSTQDLNVPETWTVQVDVNAGEKVYFLMDHIGNGNESQMHIKAASYIFGDLSTQSTTFCGVQETGVYDGKFDVNFLSATKDGTYSDMGFVYKVKLTKTSDGSLISESDEQTAAVEMLADYYEVYYPEDNGVPTNCKLPQDTKVMAYCLGGLSAEDTTVEIIVYSYTTVGNVTETDTAVIIKYVDGVFNSIVNDTND